MKERSTTSSPWLFFAFVFCWTWLYWLASAALKTSIETTLGMTLLILGILGPMLGGIGFTYMTQGKEGWREYWSRIVDPRRIGMKWYLVILFFVPAIMAIALLLEVASAGTGALLQVEKRVAPFLSAPSTIIPFALGVFVRGPFPEELGWRGYVLDRLQARWDALGSSLILGAFWALWHLPLFFIRDMPHYTQGIWSPWFWQFMGEVIAMAVILTWIYNNTRCSTLAAIIFHFITNVTYILINVTAGTNFYSTLLWIIAAIAVIALWKLGKQTPSETINLKARYR